MGWVTAGDHEVARDDGQVVCRNAAGRRLKRMPAKLADDPAPGPDRRHGHPLRHPARGAAEAVAEPRSGRFVP
ncbi:hypothetical protein STENM327S_01594 [Streptomyces tendae]